MCVYASRDMWRFDYRAAYEITEWMHHQELLIASKIWVFCTRVIARPFRGHKKDTLSKKEKNLGVLH